MANPSSVNLPESKVAWISLVAQAGKVQYLTVVDNNGNPVVNLSGKGGTSGTPEFIGGQTFTINSSTTNSALAYDVYITTGNYYMTVGSTTKNSGVTLEKVISSNCQNLIGGTVYTQTYTFASEDSTDNDYNDSFVTLSWFDYAG